MEQYPIFIQPCDHGEKAVSASNQTPLCAFTVDVEDWYQANIDFDAPITERVVRNTERVLAVLDDYQVKATFFVQGRVAETFPQLLQTLLAEGHEIQSHGYSHRPLYKMGRQALQTELEWGRKTIEDACGVQVTAFRAPDFSILNENLWAFEVLVENGFEIDSSIFPMRTHRYGIANWEVMPHHLLLANGASILEVPVAVWTMGKFRFPIAGGGYFRLIPSAIIERILNDVTTSSRPAIIYCHPYEFSTGELDDYRHQAGLSFRFMQGIGRRSFVTRIRNLLTRLPFGRFDQVLERLELI
ncbi:MAG: polysaccharide deacetylase family protein [Anaerolineae bacterium]|nr:polysaccharide deacetylase family protein [Anaerolineae bacterium]